MNNNKTSKKVHKEYAALETVPKSERTISFLDMLTTWIGANANNGTWYVGGVVAGATFGGAALVTLVSNPIAYVIMALIGFIGYKVGTSTMALTRPAFGVRGSFLPSVLNITQFIGWTAVNTFIAAISISYILKDMFELPAYGSNGSEKTMLIGIAIMSILHIVSIATGHKSVKMVEKIGVVFILILGVWETVVVLKQVPLSQIIAWRPPSGKVMDIGLAFDAMAAFSLGWVPAIADFTRYSKSKKASTVAPIIGANVGLFWFAFVGIIGAIGTAVTTGVYDPNNSDPSTIVSKLGLGVIALLVIILTSTTANAINLMGAGISVTNLNKKIKSQTALFGVTIFAAILTVVPIYATSFLDSFEMFLDYVGMVFGPIFGIMIADYYLVRKKQYEVEEFDDEKGEYWYKNGFNLVTISVWLISVIIFLIMKNLPILTKTIGAIYPIIIISGTLYFVSSKIFFKNKQSNKEVEEVC
ncbi:cytosine permease [Clostridium sp.]|jgi:nucleobase:cation symporter-1, NCS1 family|uniref:cytosine permease n=1 Tax=Clostridium sp. TaxID=1506 RepID=UPI003A5BC1CE